MKEEQEAIILACLLVPERNRAGASEINLKISLKLFCANSFARVPQLSQVGYLTVCRSTHVHYK